MDTWKSLQSKSKANAAGKISWVVYSLGDKKKGKVEAVQKLSDEEKDDQTDEARHKAFTDVLLKAGEPRFGGIDFGGHVFFVSFICDNTHGRTHKFAYAQAREAFKGMLSGVSFDIKANSPGEMALSEFKEKVATKAV